MTEDKDTRIAALKAQLAEANKRYAYEGHAKMVVLEQLSAAKAEVSRLTEALQKAEAENVTLRMHLEALSRTGGVKAKALEWEEIHQRRSDADPTTEVVGYEAGIPGLWWRIDVEAADFSLVSPEYSYQTFGTLEAAKAAAQADFERRILSALEAQLENQRRRATNGR